MTVDLTPGVPDEDAAFSLTAPALWFTFDPQPVPAAIPLVGQGHQVPAGDQADEPAQVGEQSWMVQMAWADAESYDRTKATLVEAGFVLTDESKSWRLTASGSTGCTAPSPAMATRSRSTAATTRAAAGWPPGPSPPTEGSPRVGPDPAHWPDSHPTRPHPTGPARTWPDLPRPAPPAPTGSAGSWNFRREFRAGCSTIAALGRGT